MCNFTPAGLLACGSAFSAATIFGFRLQLYHNKREAERLFITFTCPRRAFDEMDEIEEAKDLVKKWETDINEHRRSSNRNQGLAAVFMVDTAEKKLNSILKSLKGKDSI